MVSLLAFVADYSHYNVETLVSYNGTYSSLIETTCPFIEQIIPFIEWQLIVPSTHSTFDAELTWAL